MSVTLTGTGGLFTREGVIAARVRDANLYLGATDISSGGLKAVGVGTNNIEAQFQSALQNEVDGLYTQRDSVRSSLSGWKSYMRTLGTNVLIDQVHADAVLVSKDATTAATELIRQMVGSGTIYNADNDLNANAVSVAVTAVTANTGTGVCVASVKRTDGRANEYVLAETAEAICTTDAGLGATARSEPFTVLGEVAQTDTLAFDWPAGSGASTSMTATDPALDASGNLLTNGDFETFTVTDTPDNFTILVGAASTDIFKEASVIYRGSYALKFTGTGGSPLSSVAQTMNTSSGGTTGVLLPNTIYAVNFWARKESGLVAGVIKVDLIDGSNTNIADDSGTANSTTVAFGTLTTSYAAYNAVFVTPKSLPSTYKLRISVSTALTSGKSAYIDDVSLVQMTPLYTNGPLVAVFAGATNFLKGDQFHIAVSNSYEGVMQTYLGMKFFDLRSTGLQFPSDAAAGETIADSLVS